MSHPLHAGDRVQDFLLPASTKTGIVNPSPRVLIIEDDPSMQDCIRLSLEPYGFQFIEAASGDQGLHRTRIDLPDVVLLDLGLPDLNGFDVLTQLREWTTVPVIAIAARGDARILDAQLAVAARVAALGADVVVVVVVAVVTVSIAVAVTVWTGRALVAHVRDTRADEDSQPQQ